MEEHNKKLKFTPKQGNLIQWQKLMLLTMEERFVNPTSDIHFFDPVKKAHVTHNGRK